MIKRFLPIVPTLFVGCLLTLVACSSNDSTSSEFESDYSDEELEQMRRDLLEEPGVNETIILDTTFNARGNYPTDWEITFEKEGGAATLTSAKLDKPYTFKTPGAVRGKGNSMILAGVAEDGSRVEMRLNSMKCQDYKTLDIQDYSIRVNIAQKEAGDKILFMGCGSFVE